MQLIVNQDEIASAVEMLVRSQIDLKPGMDVSVEFTNVRSPNGMTAEVSITASKDAPAAAPTPKAEKAPEPKAVKSTPVEETKPEPVEEAAADQPTEDEAPQEEAADPKPAEKKNLFNKPAESANAGEDTQPANDSEEATKRTSIFSKAS